MKQWIQIFFILLGLTGVLQADLYVIAKASRTKQPLLQERSDLYHAVSDLVSHNQVAVFASEHPVWKWRLGVGKLPNRAFAEKVLARVRQTYPDAYILTTVKRLPKQTRSQQKRVQKHYTPKQHEEMVEVNFSNLSIEDFIRMVSKITGKNILIPKKLEGTINFIGIKPIPKSKLIPLLNQILLSNGYTLIDTRNGFLNIVESKNAIKNAPPLMGSSTVGSIQTAILPFHNINAVDLMKQVKSLVSRYGKVSVAGSINSLIVTDFSANIRAIADIIKAADRRGDSSVRFVTFSHVDVKSIYPKVSKLVHSYFSDKSRNNQIQIIRNENANSIALVGNREDIAKILPFVRRLDAGSDQKQRDIEMVYVKNTDAASVVKLLNNLVSAKSFRSNIENIAVTKAAKKSVPAEKTKGKKGTKADAAPLVQEPVVTTGEADEPSITYDKQLNAVIIFGTKKEREVFKKIIHQLDVERKQVYVRAKIVEINNDKASKIGMQYGVVGGVANSSGLYALSNKMGLDDASVGMSLANSLNLDIPNVKKIVALGAAISLLTENSAANILSEPSILCINNEPSSLYVGKTVSVVSQSSVGTSTTDISRNIYSREDIGLTLKITPRISADHKVALGVEIISEDVLPGSPVGLPKTTKRVVKTSAIVKNGETIIVGGLVRDKESTNVSGVPILSKIPLFGKLFQHESKAHEKTTLILMLTPYIIEQSADLSRLRQELGKLYTFEQNFAKKVHKVHHKNR